MARVTVEDCVVKVPNRFELVLLAAQRAREITSGAPLSLDRDDDKNPVVALREIAETTVALDHLQESLVRGMQKHVEMDEPEEAPELEQTLFGIADPVGPVISENEVDEEALEEELEEDLLTLEDEEEDLPELAGEDEDEEGDEPAAEDAEGWPRKCTDTIGRRTGALRVCAQRAVIKIWTKHRLRGVEPFAGIGGEQRQSADRRIDRTA